MQTTVKENHMVSPYFLFFLIHSSQTGISMLNFQSNIIKGAGQDAWLSVLLYGLFLNVIYLMMLYIIKQSSSGDIISFHKDIFGNVIGGLLNIILASYFAMISVSIIHTYIDLLQIWVFDGITSIEFSLLFCILIYYIVSGGFRIITAICFWGVVIPSMVVSFVFYLFAYVDISYIQPLFQHKISDYFRSAIEVVPTYLGFELVLVILPFIRGGIKAKKWGHFALLVTTLLYTLLTIVTFIFFTQGKLEKLTWPTLTMIKIIRFPFLERIEFIFIFTWLLVILAPICLYLWSAIRCVKFTFTKIKPTYILLFFLGTFVFINSKLIDMTVSYYFDRLATFGGIILLFVYIPLLFLIALLRNFIKMVRNLKMNS